MTNDHNNQPRKGAVLALVLVVVLLVIGIALQRHMRANSQLEDCLLSGRKNCAPIQ